MAKVSIDDFAEAINEMLDGYSDDVLNALVEATDEVAKQTVTELKQTSPKQTSPKQTGGKYAKSWTKQKAKRTTLSATSTVYNRRYQLTHLLENGHATRNGGRTKAYPHIAPAEDKLPEKLYTELKKRL